MKSWHAIGVSVGMVGILITTSCDRTASSEATSTPKPSADLVAVLVEDVDKLRELRRLCREQRDRVDDDLCAASALAARRRFMGLGQPLPRAAPAARRDQADPKPE